MLGKSIQGAHVYLYPHLHFTLGYNGNSIVTANVTTDAKRRVDITDTTTGQEVCNTSSALPDPHHFANRFHFLSLLNGFIRLRSHGKIA